MGVLPETSFWDVLQQKECQRVDEFYREARKFLKLEDSKEALSKTEGTTTAKKNDLRPGVDSQKGQDKRRGEDKRARNPKKQKNGPLENKGPLSKYTNYHSLTILLDHVYAVIDKSL